MAKVIIPQVAFDGNEKLKGLADDARRKGAPAVAEGDNVVYGVSDDKLPMNAAQLVVSVGGDVLEWPLFIEIDDEDDDVPLGLIGDTSTDEDGVVTNNTWSTWLAPNNHIIERDGRKFVSTKANTGKSLPMSQLMVVSDDLVLLKDLPVSESVE